MLLHDSMVLTGTEPQVSHRPNLLPSLGSGAHKAVLPLLALVTACDLADGPGSGQDPRASLDMRFSDKGSKIGL